MRPLDPRLLRWAQATKVFLVASVLIGVVTAVTIILQAYLLAGIITEVFQQGASLSDITPQVMQLAGVVIARSLLAFAVEWTAFHSSARAKSQLRLAVLDHALALGPQYLEGRNAGELAQLTSRGIDALDNYFARYLPQLVLAVIVPLTVGIVIATQDLLAAVIIALTIPLIPVFMILVGLYTKSQVDRQWTTLGLLAGHFLDVVAGLPTLKLFGRAKAQATTLREIGDQYRRTTMGVLRVSFLSALVLELLATLSVAIVAVAIGLRLVNGDMTLYTGLVVLILAPEAYLPVRMVGAQFHAAADGIAASGQMLDILDEPLPEAAADSTRITAPVTITVSDLGYTYPTRSAPAFGHMSFTAEPGTVTALAGPSGSGKSTALRVILGFLSPGSGTVTANGTAVGALQQRDWLDHVAWLPQEPVMLAGTVRENILLGRPAAADTDVVDAARRAGVVTDAADVLAQEVGEGGAGVSVGQRRRIGLARVLLRDSAVILLDEPSAALDEATELRVADAIDELRRRNRTVLLVAHRPALRALADQTIELQASEDYDAPADEHPIVAMPGLGR